MLYILWRMVHGLWFMVCGLWFMVYGLWFMVYGLWFVVCGLWFMVYGLAPLVQLEGGSESQRPDSFPQPCTCSPQESFRAISTSVGLENHQTMPTVDDAGTRAKP
jgi:hypothetical protein